MKQLILLMISCLSLVACGNGNAKQEREKEDSGVADKEKVEVLYFHGKQRCATCKAIESNAMPRRLSKHDLPMICRKVTSYSGRLIFPVPKMGRLPKSMK